MSQLICITGASSGIGTATAKVFARNRFSLAIGARREDRVQGLKKELLTLGAPDVLACHLDVTEANSVENFCLQMETKFQRGPDILVNNAGGALGLESIVTGDEKQWQQMLDANVMGLLRMTKRCVPHMIALNAGHVINIGSIAGHYVYEGGGVYCASKFAVDAITKTLKLELNDFGIRVTTIDPGLVETEFSMVRLKDPVRAKAVYAGMTPLSPEDIAECIYFVASRPKHVNIDEIIITPTDQASINKVRRVKDGK